MGLPKDQVENLKAAADRIANGNKKKPAAGLPGFRRIERTSEETRRLAAEAEEIRVYTEGVQAAMDDNVSGLWFCLNGTPEHRETHEPKFAEYAHEIRLHVLNNPSDVCRKAAIAAYATALVRDCPSTKWALIACAYGPRMQETSESTPGLVELGILMEFRPDGDDVPDFAVRIARTIFRATPSRNGFSQTIVENLKTKVVEALAKAKAAFEAASRALLARSTPNFGMEGLINRKPGMIGFTVRRTQNSPGGTVLVESDGEEVWIVDAVGYIQKPALEIRELGHKLPTSTLQHQNWEDARTEISYVSAPIYQSWRFIHDIVIRTVRGDARRDARMDEKAEFKAKCTAEELKPLQEKATTTTEAWLLDNKTGTASVYVSYWESRPPDEDPVKFFHVSLLVERADDGQIRIVEVPERMDPLFCHDDMFDFHAPGESFENLPKPLGLILRKAYAMAQNERRQADRARKAEHTDEVCVSDDDDTTEPEVEVTD